MALRSKEVTDVSKVKVSIEGQYEVEAFDPGTEETWGKWHFLVREEPAAPPSF